MKDKELYALRALHGTTTPGPWKSFIEGRDHESGSDFIQTAEEDIELSGASQADQDFVAAVHEALPQILRQIQALNEENRFLKTNLLNLVTDSFNNALHPLREAGVIDGGRLSSKYAAGTKLYNRVTDELEQSIERYLRANQIGT